MIMKKLVSLSLALFLVLQNLSLVTSANTYPIGDSNTSCIEFDVMQSLLASLLQCRNEDYSGEAAISPYSMVTGCMTPPFPSTGNVKLLVLPIDFPDYPIKNSDYENLEQHYNSDYNPAFEYYSQEQSVRGVFLHASYGRFNLTATILPVFHAPEQSTFYSSNRKEWEFLIYTAIEQYVEDGLNLKDYDIDNNGIIDGIAIKYSVPPSLGFFNASAGNFIYHQQISGVVFENYTRTHINSETNTDVHEIGHLLGLPDTYNPNYPYSYIAVDDIMSGGTQLFNVYYKYLLGWVDPVIVTNTDSVQTFELICSTIYASNHHSKPKAIIFIPDETLLPYSEYFMAEYREAAAYTYDAKEHLYKPVSGVILWHVNAAIDSKGCYQFQKNFLKPVYRSGAELNAKYTENDVFIMNSEFSNYSTPVKSLFYNSIPTNAFLRVNDINGNTASISVGFDPVSTFPIPTPTPTPTLTPTLTPTPTLSKPALNPPLVAISDISTHWAQEAILQVVKEDIMTVDETGKFHPNAFVSRSDFFAALCEYMNLNSDSNTTNHMEVTK